MDTFIITIIILISGVSIGAVLFSAWHSMNPEEKKEFIDEANLRGEEYLFEEDESFSSPGSSRNLIIEPSSFSSDDR
ncbi:hypothetical protein [Thermodesulfovibrio thiophilus]|uniref:hypothetical protein n=1 Tax=Thermodesulfovibrio thiophilus TaxID=340095 RepID=UPI00041E57F4|nr:hypothetical protein [Thermodesulfovibrio thiophilus]